MSRSPSLYIGTILASFNSSGKYPIDMQRIISIAKIGEITVSQTFNNFLLIPKSPVDVLFFNFSMFDWISPVDVGLRKTDCICLLDWFILNSTCSIVLCLFKPTFRKWLLKLSIVLDSDNDGWISPLYFPIISFNYLWNFFISPEVFSKLACANPRFLRRSKAFVSLLCISKASLALRLFDSIL